MLLLGLGIFLQEVLKFKESDLKYNPFLNLYVRGTSGYSSNKIF